MPQGKTNRSRNARGLLPSHAELLESRLLMSFTWVVSSTADDGSAGTLRYAIDNSSANDVIQFSPSVFTGGSLHSITLSGTPLDLTHNLVIQGLGPSVVAVDGNKSSGLFHVEQGTTTTISGLTLTHGSESQGGGIYNAGTLTVANCTLSANIAAAGTQGGGIYNNGVLTLAGSTLSGNSAGTDGGGVFNGNGTVSVGNCQFIGNTAGSGFDGAAISGGGSLMVSDSTFSNNHGGAVYCLAGSAAVYNSTFTGNKGSVAGGIVSGAPLTVYGSTFTGNSGQLTAGAIATTTTRPASIVGSTFTANTGVVAGALSGQNANGTLNVAQSTFTNNQSTSPSRGGGAIFVGGSLNLSASTFSGNSSRFSGGAIENTGVATAVNDTFFGNSSQYGGAISDDQAQGRAAPRLIATNCTISGNTAGQGGGINAASGVALLHNTVVAGNTAMFPNSPADIVGGVFGSNNLIGDGTGGLDPTQGNLMGTSSNPLDPRLAPLGNYGGPTQTMALLAGSPALDAGSAATAFDVNGQPLTSDQRGLLRAYGANPDIGAYEAQPPSLMGDVNHDGTVNMADLTLLVRNFGKAVPLYEGGDLNGDGVVDASDWLLLARNFGKAATPAVSAFSSALVQPQTSSGSLAADVVNSTARKQRR